MNVRTTRGLLTLIVCGAILAGLPACGSSESDDPAILLRWTFGDDLEGWSEGSDQSGLGSGFVSTSNADAHEDAPDAEDGSVKLDGTGNPGVPNSWIFRQIAIPAEASTLAWWAAGHDRDGGNAHLRVRVESAGSSTTLMNWAEYTGREGVHEWRETTVDIGSFAGETVTLFFEQDDNGPGSHEQIYIDDIRIIQD